MQWRFEKIFTFLFFVVNLWHVFVIKGKVTSKIIIVMSIFNLFNKRNNGATFAPMMSPAFGAPELLSETVSDTKQESSMDKNNTLTVSYATGWPIDVIYGYLHKNYEEKGFNDAMVKSDLTFKEILMVFREINLNYDVMKQDIETRMETCNAAGLLTTLAELEKHLSIIETHKEELARLEKDFRNNANEASVPLQSYECGFLRGISTIMMTSPKKSSVAPQPASVPSFPLQRATA